MKQLTQYYNRLNLLAFGVFIILVFLQSIWLWNATLLQQKENELQLKQIINDAALEVNSLGHQYFHGDKDSISIADLEIEAIEEKVQNILDSNAIKIPTYFAVFKETDSTVFVSNQSEYKAEMLASDIKSCISSIVSFSMVSKEEGTRGPDESEEDFAKRLQKVSTFQYFSPVKNLVKNDRIWLVLHQPSSFSDALRSLTTLFITNIILLLVLLFLFNHLLKLLSNYRKISELKEDFFNNMTHEFKTPLSSIRLASRVLRQNKTPEKAATYHDLIEKESKTLESQIDKLLELSLLDNKEIELEKEAVNVHELISNIPNRMKPLLESKQGNIIVDLKMTEPILWLDQQHFSNSLCNLVENSLKYSEESVTIWIHTFTKNGSNFITIKDNGHGILPEFQPHIFERFYRAKKSNEYKTKGFGIGLSYVKSIVEAHNGTIRLNPNYANGCEFIIKI